MFERLAALLEYPASPEGGAAAAMACAAGNPRAAVHLAAFAGAAGDMSLAELQEFYTKTFDFDADTALYVGHHVFGEDGRRGLFMAGLVQRYRTLGIDAGTELPDHIALVLRSLAVDGDSDEAHELVTCALLPAIMKLLPALERRAPPYAALLSAIALLLERSQGETSAIWNHVWTSSSLPSSPTLR